MNKRKWWVVAALIWMIIIFLVTQLPYFTGERTASAIHRTIAAQADYDIVGFLNLLLRKATHIIAFGVLSVFLLKSMETLSYSYLLSLIFTSVYAMSDEYHQSFMPGRVASFEDVLFDSFGALLAMAILFFYQKRKKVN